MAAGYSGTSLVNKLGIKANTLIALVNAPQGYSVLLGDLPMGITLRDAPGEGCNLIQYFTSERAALENDFPALKSALKIDGALWVSWPKKASKLPTDLTEDIIRDIGLRNGLVDVKVIAVDAVWSGLKFVYRVKDRT